jgi:4-hydroxy 2-oxovalerate aldolase
VTVRITDVTLRDGSHTVSHQFSVEQVVSVATALADAGIPVVEVSHGDGLGGSSLTYGRSLIDERELIAAAAPILASRGSRTAVLLLPGIGVAEELEVAAELGASVARVATHCTEADISAQHLGKARDLGMEAVGFLMMAHMASPEELADQARIQEACGAQVVYCTDSAGALTPDGTAARVSSIRDALEPSTVVGFHAHNNLGLAVANTLTAIQSGAEHIDSATRGLGAGAGNCPTEAIVAVCDRVGIPTGVDVMAIANAAEDVVSKVAERRPAIDRSSLILGWAGVYSSFLLHAERAAERYKVSAAEILLEVGRRKAVGGQEDMIVEIALELSSRSQPSIGPR